MNFKVYIVGDKIEKFYLEGIKEYEKRLSRYCKIKLQKFKNKESHLAKSLINNIKSLCQLARKR
ncbi:23S rRNA (pseudouridine(1915)-N(3))-methyltransferase RlmH [Bacillus sp. FJAT-45350]|uniref:23S rRNA (pseudouridine(1915)-N(3))-methyltransferase RlmH n=1 Tax=Bacillus sp. FJAT-45350 TaxID=2011014 RepID=UPI0015CB7A67